MRMVVERIAELRSIPIRDIIAARAIDATTALVLAGRGAWKRSPVGLAGDRLKSRQICSRRNRERDWTFGFRRLEVEELADFVIH